MKLSTPSMSLLCPKILYGIKISDMRKGGPAAVLHFHFDLTQASCSFILGDAALSGSVNKPP